MNKNKWVKKLAEFGKPYAWDWTGNPHPLISFISTLLEEQREEAYKEIYLVIESWRKGFGIEKEWDDNLHPADILDKYVFPALVSKEEIVGAVPKKSNHHEPWFNDGYNQALTDILKAIKDL